jgi:hypothetical protein
MPFPGGPLRREPALERVPHFSPRRIVETCSASYARTNAGRGRAVGSAPASVTSAVIEIATPVCIWQTTPALVKERARVPRCSTRPPWTKDRCHARARLHLRFALPKRACSSGRLGRSRVVQLGSDRLGREDASYQGESDSACIAEGAVGAVSRRLEALAAVTLDLPIIARCKADRLNPWELRLLWTSSPQLRAWSQGARSGRRSSRPPGRRGGGSSKSTRRTAEQHRRD